MPWLGSNVFRPGIVSSMVWLSMEVTRREKPPEKFWLSASQAPSDCQLIAPVTVGRNAYTASGSTITEDVPAGALAIGRARQRNILGWVKKKKG